MVKKHFLQLKVISNLRWSLIVENVSIISYTLLKY